MICHLCLHLIYDLNEAQIKQVSYKFVYNCGCTIVKANTTINADKCIYMLNSSILTEH